MLSRRSSLALAAFAGLFGSRHAFAIGSYALTDLGAYVSVGGINASGQIVGSIQDADYSFSRAFKYSNGVLTQLPPLHTPVGNESTYDYGADISDDGTVVGYGDDDNGNQRGFAQVGSSQRIMGNLPGGHSSEAFGISPNGSYATGDAYVNGTVNGKLYQRPFTAVRFQPISASSLDLLAYQEPADSAESFGNAVNNAGAVAGQFGYASSYALSSIYYPANGGTAKLIGTLGGYGSTPYAINNNNVVVGTADTASGSRHAFRYTVAGGIVDIGGLDTQSAANDINDSGMIVGSAYHLGGGSEGADPLQQRAFLLSNGVYTDLNTVTSGASGFSIQSAISINANGQIAADGVDTGGVAHGFLLTPISDAVSTGSASLVGAGNTRLAVNVGGTSTGGQVTAAINGTGSTFTVKYDPNLSVLDLYKSSSDIHASAPITFQLTSGGPFGQAWEISSDGTVSNATVTFHYDESQLAAGTDESQLRIYHFDTGSGQWVLPAGEVVDTVLNTITLQTNSFSPFVLGLAAVPEPACVTLVAAGIVGGMIRRRRA